MVTKYIVRDDNIYLYEDNEIVETLPNTVDNLKLAKLYNNQIFVNDDLNKAKNTSDYYQTLNKKKVIKTIIAFIFLLISKGFNLPAITLLCSYITMFNVISFVMNNAKLKSSDRRINYLKTIKSKIEDEIECIKNSLCTEKEDNQQLEFSNEQIVNDHRNWITSYGDYYDYSNDVEMINNQKILIKK